MTNATQATASVPVTQSIAPTRAIHYNELNGKQRFALRKQAQRDYEQARGTAHQRMLLDTRHRLERERLALEKQLKELQQHTDSGNRSEQVELRQLLERHIIHDRLTEVSGIGPELKARILVTLKPNTLTDLRRAGTVQGVGESRMAGIEVWISRYSQQIPVLLTKPFPGREEVDRRVQIRIDELRRNRDKAQTALAGVMKSLTEIDQHLAWLKATTVETYVDAARGKPDAQTQIARYTIGLFPEWEPLPAWFKQLVDGKVVA